MKYEKFEKLIKDLQMIRDRSSTLHDLGIDIMNYEEPYHRIISELMDKAFGKNAHDWIDWFIYERVTHSGEILKAWDKDQNEICYDIKSLWEEITK
jgi:hypothetical protein